jgi:hypothetical protein
LAFLFFAATTRDLVSNLVFEELIMVEIQAEKPVRRFWWETEANF